MRMHYLYSHIFCSIIFKKRGGMMEITLEIPNRTYNDIETYCSINQIDIQEYIIGMIEEKHSINKYGDLNDMMPKVIEEKTVEVKHRGRPKKQSTEEKPKQEEEFNKTKVFKNIEEEENVEQPKEIKEEQIIKSTVKRKRSLKTI